LKENQGALTSGLEDLVISQRLQEPSKLPVDDQPAMMPEKKVTKSNLDSGFSSSEMEILKKQIQI